MDTLCRLKRVKRDMVKLKFGPALGYPFTEGNGQDACYGRIVPPVASPVAFPSLSDFRIARRVLDEPCFRYRLKPLLPDKGPCLVV